MLSRKGSCAGMMSAAAAGVDRSRVGERLQAALAGLQELHLLKDRQSDMVSWALRMDREEPLAAVHAGSEAARTVGAEEQRLEATLTALKQQLSRLRKQDVGLKSHLQQLDQQISELKLDVSKASTEQLESDSRPSSGFYELSDGGSCSLSNSCTSVYSECLSSSQTSLLLPLSPPNPFISPPSQADVCRRRSADESTTQPNPPRATGLHLGSSRIRASTTGTEQTRPRPVSTGDLDRMMAQGPSYFKSGDAKKPSICPNLKTSTMDPKFQSNLVSRSGTEVYHYPSPLHAVALQSPIFSAGGNPATPGLIEGQAALMNGSYQRAQTGKETKTLGYIDKLLQRSLSKIQSEAGTETRQTHSDYPRKPTEVITMFQDVSQKEVFLRQPHPALTTNIIQLDRDQKRHCMTFSSQEPTDNTNHKEPERTQEVPYRYSFPVAMYSSDEITTSTQRKNGKPQGEYHSAARSHSEKRCGENPESRPQERKDHRQRPAHSSSTEESQCFEVHAGHTASTEFVHAKFVPAGSQRVKVRQADRKTKAVKLRRKGADKSRSVRQQYGYSSGERTREAGGGTKGEQRRSVKGKTTQKINCHTEERRQGSGSDSSHCSPGVMYTHKVHPKPHPVPAVTKSSKSRRLPCMESEQSVVQRKRRQGAPKWPSNAEMFQVACAQRQRSKDPHFQAPGSMQMVRSMSAKPGQWSGPPRPFQTSMSTNSFFFHNLNARYPPAPYHMSSLYPPRCESEYSAECASLFHSTIAESSEGEMSDNTTNRFGDSESSQSFQSLSDSDSSLSLDEEDQVDSHEEGNLVWAEVALGPTAAGRPLQQLPPPEPSACRIKASRALKKKIRRFQPASMKVMTLV
ncbi:dapper homolog 2 [Solea solea]|uniref:dapper homolog 2 n=1 Tax=Solea solea TaxID=90069 RepID=UPI0027294ECE|nr:dapper homolog 2 [Solea solea]